MTDEVQRRATSKWHYYWAFGYRGIRVLTAAEWCALPEHLLRK